MNLLCECGCKREITEVYTRTRPQLGYVQGHPKRFIRGHGVDQTKIKRLHGKEHPSYKHGHTLSGAHTPTWRSYSAMLRRCYNPNWWKFDAYGGRGVSVCERWRGEHGFENFLFDMGVRPQNKTLDRKNNNGNYGPDNCHWATQTEQKKNQRPVTDAARHNMSLARRRVLAREAATYQA